jgi:4-amino-4-deoxy-L-arabinose transferase-like glycosyltransferase
MALPIVISDALTVVPVYLIGKRLLTERYAFIASLLFALAPINLLYVDYVWLNPPLTTFFLMASVYFLLVRRYDLSAFTLAISIGLKQTSLLALPIALFFIAKKLSYKMASRYLLMVTSICFAFSFPYILVEPRLYLYSIFRLPIGSWGEPLSVRVHESSRIDCDR